MTQTNGPEVLQPERGVAGMGATKFSYDYWMEEQDVPIHRGFYIEDLREIEVAEWRLRHMKTAFVQLMGMEGINELRVTELAPGETTEPFKFGLDEIVYVLEGRGLTTVWGDEGGEKKTFEWSPRSMFFLPRHFTHQFSNTSGQNRVRLMHYNYLGLVLSGCDTPDFFFNNPYKSAPMPADNIFAEAKAYENPAGRGRRMVWYGNFFPDMQAWDRLEPFWGRGAGGSVVGIQFPNSEASCHMSVFPAQTYKKGHRHGPGRAIVIPGGEGYSILWQNENAEKVIVPWHEASLFTPPNRWFHQHFNLGTGPGRYLALHPLPQFAGHAEQIEDRARDQFEYPNEDPMIRERFEAELAKRGMKSLMPEEAYKDPNFEWDYGEEWNAKRPAPRS
jgi:hypothetical protein